MCSGNGDVVTAIRQRVKLLLRLSHRLDHEALVAELEALDHDLLEIHPDRATTGRSEATPLTARARSA